MKNLLFVCSRNKWRSPTGEKIWARSASFNTRSAGTSARANRVVNSRDIEWADVIFVMENKHKNRLLANFRQTMNYKKVVVLDIPDDYRFMDAELVEVLKQAVTPHLADL